MPRPWLSSDAARATLRALAIACGVVIGIALLSRLPFAERFSEHVQSSAVAGGTSLGNALGRFFASEDSLGTQLAACQAKAADLATAAVQAAALEQEIGELRLLLEYRPPAETHPITARVIARALDGDPSTVLIDQGKADGITAGSAVVIGDGMLYGIVYAVRDETSVIRLVTHPDVQVPSGILGKAPTIGLTHGREGELLSMEFVPQDVELLTGDLVVTSGLDGKLPANLLLGRVTQIIDVESAPFQNVLLELFYDPRAVTAVLVLTPAV